MKARLSGAEDLPSSRGRFAVTLACRRVPLRVPKQSLEAVIHVLLDMAVK